MKGLFYFSFNKTAWRQKTLAIGIGRYVIDGCDYIPRYYLAIGINLIFWYLTFAVRLSSKEAE